MRSLGMMFDLALCGIRLPDGGANHENHAVYHRSGALSYLGVLGVMLKLLRIRLLGLEKFSNPGHEFGSMADYRDILHPSACAVLPPRVRRLRLRKVASSFGVRPGSTPLDSCSGQWPPDWSLLWWLFSSITINFTLIDHTIPQHAHDSELRYDMNKLLENLLIQEAMKESDSPERCRHEAHVRFDGVSDFSGS
ncbi:hypothetical protein VNO77_03683 [Canavalia gladiata]|uniref:Uncharacterized protein n=1 Tax=Canavalia gladiata TaxID=3824 RepID=A0AAN9N1K5_CANGL